MNQSITAIYICEYATEKFVYFFPCRISVNDNNYRWHLFAFPISRKHPHKLVVSKCQRCEWKTAHKRNFINVAILLKEKQEEEKQTRKAISSRVCLAPFVYKFAVKMDLKLRNRKTESPFTVTIDISFYGSNEILITDSNTPSWTEA